MYGFLAEDFIFNNRLTELQFKQLYFSERSDYDSDSDLSPTVLPLVPFNSHPVLLKKILNLHLRKYLIMTNGSRSI